MIFHALEVGPLGTNCYVIGCEKTGACAVIDPGAEGEKIISVLKKLNLSCKYIIVTHGHMDHISALQDVKQATGAGVLIHAADAERLVSPGPHSTSVDRLLEDGDTIQVGEITLEVIHTPGHTQGGICLKTGDVLFAGDTLFAGSVGRSDLPGGSHGQLINSVKTKLFVFPDHTGVYSGHGPASTIGEEKKFNPFF